METQSQYAIRNMSTEELVQFVNDNIDTFIFKFGEINEVENTEFWDDLGEYLGGYMLMDILTRFPKPEKAKYCQFDSEQKCIYWYSTKRDIIETISEDILTEWYECSLD